ncbi:MAG: hypothetical protein COZ06_23780, partial [Armatimonadetes bacterium CG_4_10_14_3_um_filter_66_18]
AWKLFQEPRKKGDLDGMMGIIRVVEGNARQLRYPRVLEDMLDAALSIAQPAGRWADLGDLYTWRAGMAASLPVGTFCWGRSAHFVALAGEAYLKAGKKPEPLLSYLQDQTKSADPRWVSQDKQARSQLLSPSQLRLAEALEKAAEQASDAEALALMGEMLRQAGQEADDWCRLHLMYRVAAHLWVRGSERLLPLFRHLVESGREPMGWTTAIELLSGCAAGWSGRNDAFREAVYWCLRHAEVHPEARSMGIMPFARKLHDFGRYSEAEELVRRWVTPVWDMPIPRDQSIVGRYRPYLGALWKGCPADIRRALVSLATKSCLATGSPLRDLFGYLRGIPDQASPGQERIAALETGFQLIEAARQSSVPDDRTSGVAEAAALLERGGRRDLADQARALAAALAQGDPSALLSCVVITAKTAAAGSLWQDVESQLESALAAAGLRDRSAFEATLLLERAKRALGKPTEAETCLAKAKGLVSQVGLSGGEQASYLTRFAAGTTDRAEGTRLLEQAKAAAEGAGLEAMVEKLTQQLAELSLGSGNLPSAKKALQDLVKQQEAKRDR